MAAFFTCIILIGIGIIIFAFFMMLSEKRRMHDYRVDLKDKKEDLIRVIEDAEELISEMNRFSDYVVTQIEEKHSELSKSIEHADLKIDFLNSYKMAEDAHGSETKYNEEAVLKIIEEGAPTDNTQILYNKGKVLTFDLKRREILKLAKSGLDSTEIARLLNCGKGEIELIAKMGR